MDLNENSTVLGSGRRPDSGCARAVFRSIFFYISSKRLTRRPARAAHTEAGGSSGAKKRALTVTLKRKGGTLGISVDPNNHQITNVVEGGAGDTAGLCVGDFIAEVNGKSTTGGSFGKLLPAAATAEIRLRLIRVQVVEPDHLHLPDVLA